MIRLSQKIRAPAEIYAAGDIIPVIIEKRDRDTIYAPA